MYQGFYSYQENGPERPSCYYQVKARQGTYFFASEAEAIDCAWHLSGNFGAGHFIDNEGVKIIGLAELPKNKKLCTSSDYLLDTASEQRSQA